MEGDICPLKELVAVAKELFPTGNAQFVIDEAHSNGVLGPKGAGLVSLEVYVAGITSNLMHPSLGIFLFSFRAIYVRILLTDITQVSLLGLEKEIAIRVHMCSKALSSTGGRLSITSSSRGNHTETSNV